MSPESMTDSQIANCARQNRTKIIAAGGALLDLHELPDGDGRIARTIERIVELLEHVNAETRRIELTAEKAIIEAQLTTL